MLLYKLFKLNPDFMSEQWVPPQVELTKYFRKVMVKIHPDKNPDDTATANHMTAIFNCCYLILKDEQLATQYFEYGYEAIELPYTWEEVENCYNYIEDKLKASTPPTPPPPPPKEPTPPPSPEPEDDNNKPDSSEQTPTPRRGSLGLRQAESFLDISDRRGKLKFLTKWNTLVTSWEPLEIAKDQEIFRAFCKEYARKHLRKFNNLCKKYPDLGTLFD